MAHRQRLVLFGMPPISDRRVRFIQLLVACQMSNDETAINISLCDVSVARLAVCNPNMLFLLCSCSQPTHSGRGQLHENALRYGLHPAYVVSCKGVLGRLGGK